MTRFFNWTMRHGAKILFACAIIQLVSGLVPSLLVMFSGAREMAADYNFRPNDEGALLHIALALQSIVAAALPLFGALLIDRADRWLAARARSGAGE